MAEIKHLSRLINKISIIHLFYVMILLFFVPSLQSQNSTIKQTSKKKIELKNADEDLILRDPLTGKDIHYLKGNVQLKDNEIMMWCDSAHYYPDKNQVKAYSKVHIQQGDTLNLYGNYLFYDGKSQLAFVKGNGQLIDKDTHLYTDSLNYDVANRIARYNDRGRIINDKNTLTSMYLIHI